MLRSLWLGVLAACGGGTAMPTVDGSPEADAAGPVVSLQLGSAFIGATVVDRALDVTGTHASFFVDVGGTLTEVPATQVGLDTWTAPIATGNAIVQSDACGPRPRAGVNPRLLELPSRAFRDRCGVQFGDPDVLPAFASSQLAIDVTLPTGYAGERLDLLAIGPWSDQQLASDQVPASGSTAVATQLAYLGTSRITKRDVVFLSRYLNFDLIGVFVAAPFDQTSGTDTVAGTMVANTPDHAIHAAIDPSALAARFAATHPAYVQSGISWSINAAPGHALGVGQGPRLSAGDVPMSGPSLDAMYGNPFGAQGWPAILTVFAYASRTTTSSSGVSTMTLVAAADDVGSTLTLAGLPTEIFLDGIALTTDNKQIPIDATHTVHVTFTTDAPSCTFYQLVITFVAPGNTDTGGAGTLIATEPSFDIPGAMFKQPNVPNVFFLAASCVLGGYVNAAMGDLDTFALPVSTGTLHSATFTVPLP